MEQIQIMMKYNSTRKDYCEEVLMLSEMQVMNLGRRRTWVAEQYWRETDGISMPKT